MDQFIGGLHEVLGPAESAVDKIRLFVDHHLDMVERHPDVAAVISVELRQSPKFMKEYKNPKFVEYLRTLAELIVEGMKSGELRSDMNPWLSARALFGMLDELVLAWVVPEWV